ncbi:uncharacterized protein [Medicago truncatula]|uniref:uncharacterized protein n=1 Tax=Medicago truncatula TaxID=3880 RepID=UPI000D2F415B|nr:uncharacterized protein LOC112421835 [Medicago truncatula]
MDFPLSELENSLLMLSTLDFPAPLLRTRSAISFLALSEGFPPTLAFLSLPGNFLEGSARDSRDRDCRLVSAALVRVDGALDVFLFFLLDP